MFVVFCDDTHCYVVALSFFISDDDEEGDRVTVRSNEELRAMLDWVLHSTFNQNILLSIET